MSVVVAILTQFTLPARLRAAIAELQAFEYLPARNDHRGHQHNSESAALTEDAMKTRLLPLAREHNNTVKRAPELR